MANELRITFTGTKNRLRAKMDGSGRVIVENFDEMEPKLGEEWYCTLLFEQGNVVLVTIKPIKTCFFYLPPCFLQRGERMPPLRAYVHGADRLESFRGKRLPGIRSCKIFVRKIEMDCMDRIHVNPCGVW